MYGLFSNLKTTFNEYRIKSENEVLLILESFLPWHKNFAFVFALIFLFPIEGYYIFRKGFNGIPLILYIVYIFPYLNIIYALVRKKIITFDKLSKKVIEKTTPLSGSKKIDFSEIAGVYIEQDKKIDDAPGAERIQYVRCYKVYLELVDKKKNYYIDTFMSRDESCAFAQKIAFLIDKPISDKSDAVLSKTADGRNKIIIFVIGIFSFLIIAKYFLDTRNLEGLVILIALIFLFLIVKYYLDSQKKN